MAAMTKARSVFVRLNHLPRVNDQEPIMFDDLMNLLAILSVGFPAVPWFFGARWGARGVWLSTGLAVVILLCCFPILFSVSCGACGQGAIAIFVLGPIWIASALLTVTSAAVAHYKFAR
jgi:hypothetical protein